MKLAETARLEIANPLDGDSTEFLAKLTAAVSEAKVAADKILENAVDSGTCNHDSPTLLWQSSWGIRSKRRVKSLLQACAEGGLEAHYPGPGDDLSLIVPFCGMQGTPNTLAARAVVETLKRHGFEAVLDYRTD